MPYFSYHSYLQFSVRAPSLSSDVTINFCSFVSPIVGLNSLPGCIDKGWWGFQSVMRSLTKISFFPCFCYSLLYFYNVSYWFMQIWVSHFSSLDPLAMFLIPESLSHVSLHSCQFSFVIYIFVAVFNFKQFGLYSFPSCTGKGLWASNL